MYIKGITAEEDPALSKHNLDTATTKNWSGTKNSFNATMLCQMLEQYIRIEEKGDKFSSELWFNATNAPGKSTARSIAHCS
jgi:hypothetical protein